MRYGLFDSDGFPIGFYSLEDHGDMIPAGAVEISEAQWLEMIDNPGRRVLRDGEVVACDPPIPVPTVDDYRAAIQHMVDATAQSRRYDSGNSLASYVASTIPSWSAEAQAFVAWRDAVWIYAYAELEKVEAGVREQPNVAEFLAEIEPIVWPEAG